MKSNKILKMMRVQMDRKKEYKYFLHITYLDSENNFKK